ncbi:MAG TPA: c-type cytochrome biogenesis protein CcmI [Casimicrobiaceae bacterium]|nr:c-type cytochrome biogenesis protein CcmI [Casimicrobiaceae bacterium]
MSALDESLFWVIAAAMAGAALAFVVPSLRARRSAASPARRESAVAAIYRSQLAELEREHGAGRMRDSEYAQARAETERRLLGEAAGGTDSAPSVATSRTAKVTMAIVAVALPALAFGLYALFGEPGALQRAASAEATAPDPASSASIGRDDLVAHLAHNPRDGRGWVLLARLDFAADHFSAAAESYRKGLSASPKIAADANVWCEYADALGMAQGGLLGGVPREHVMRALALDPQNPKALEMAGSAAFEQGEFASAVHYWRTLLAQLAPHSTEHRELSAAIARADALAPNATGDRAR